MNAAQRRKLGLGGLGESEIQSARRARGTRLLLMGMLFALAFPAACGSNGVVGGQCRSGYQECARHCVDPLSDVDNCGACGHRCSAGNACEAGKCVTLADVAAGSSGGAKDSNDAGNAGEASAFGGAGSAATDGNAGSGGGVGVAGAAVDVDAGSPDAGCASPYNRADACGDCATRCTGMRPICSPDGAGGFACVEQCDNPPTLCDDRCVDSNIDPLNCGSCGNACPSAICQGGKCVGANVGHVVVACLDFAQPVANSPQTVLLGNAIFLPVQSSVRILAYAEFTPAALRGKVTQELDFAAAARGRSFALTPSVSSTEVTAELDINDYEVFLIYDQPSAPAGQLAMIGTAWRSSSALSSFAAAGGVIVALSGGDGTGEMGKLFSNAQLLDVSAETSVLGQKLFNRAPADALGLNVISPFLASNDSCVFTTSATPDADTIFVIRDAVSPAAGAPVVVHRVIE